MALTEDQLKNLPFGYLRGADLMRFCPPQILIKQYQVDPDSLQDACNIAYSELISLLNTRYGLNVEFLKVGFTNASATPMINAGAVSFINVSYAGTNYGSAPVVKIMGIGTGATAEAVVENGIITDINVITGGTGYDLTTTVVITGGAAPDPRTQMFVKLAAVFAVRNALGSMQNISDKMKDDFAYADKTILALRQGQQGMPSVNQAPTISYGSPAEVVNSSFLTLG